MFRRTFLWLGCLSWSLALHPLGIPLSVSAEWETSPLLATGSFLQLCDLPSRFEDAPPFVQKLLLKGIASVNPELEKQGINVEQVATFVSIEEAEMVMGLTSRFTNGQGVETFDLQLRRADSDKIFIRGLQQSLSSLGKVTVTQVKELNNTQDIGEISRGFALEAELEKWPVSVSLSTEALAFRRGQTGVLVIIGALAHEIEDIGIQDLALVLDRRLQMVSK